MYRGAGNAESMRAGTASNTVAVMMQLSLCNTTFTLAILLGSGMAWYAMLNLQYEHVPCRVELYHAGLEKTTVRHGSVRHGLITNHQCERNCAVARWLCSCAHMCNRTPLPQSIILALRRHSDEQKAGKRCQGVVFAMC